MQSLAFLRVLRQGVRAPELRFRIEVSQMVSQTLSPRMNRRMMVAGILVVGLHGEGGSYKDERVYRVRDGS